ncbi:hypothetical protein AACH10_25195 [Ideonella sp. DXS22W]|uniref:Uncharacterized protein n=1 Tax=Pseudaquabacterium inlustre TaxID=2984192 RepID=A0ABU9CP27_9BURK
MVDDLAFFSSFECLFAREVAADRLCTGQERRSRWIVLDLIDMPAQQPSDGGNAARQQAAPRRP